MKSWDAYRWKRGYTISELKERKDKLCPFDKAPMHELPNGKIMCLACGHGEDTPLEEQK